MKKMMTVTALLAALLLASCAGPAAPPGIGDLISNIVPQSSEAADNASDVSPGDVGDFEGAEPAAAYIDWLGSTFDIHFSYVNHVYNYDIEATWHDVTIMKEAKASSHGLEILLDASKQTFTELDTDASGDISQEEWGDLEEICPFIILADGDMSVTLSEFGYISENAQGLEFEPDDYSLNNYNDKMGIEFYDMMDDAPVCLKILKAGPGGYKGVGTTFPEDTVFIELMENFTVYLLDAPYEELPPGFLTPLLSMYLKQGDANKGEYGFSSIVNSDDFMRIFNGETFELHYVGSYQGKRADEYHLAITPVN